MDYHFKVVQKNIYEVRQNELIENIRAFICIYNKDLDICFPHPISAFLDSYYINSTLSLNTIKRYAEDLKKFLNFILLKISENEPDFIDLKERGLRAITLKHGVTYLNYLYERITVNEIKSSSFYNAERVLTMFYYWLSMSKTMDNYKEVTVLSNHVDSPFRFYELDVKFPRKDRPSVIKSRLLHDFGSERLDLVIQFIKVSELIAPDITLGIIFQFFGGLRRSEVINLMNESLKIKGDGAISLDIKDNWDKIFVNKSNFLSEQVKNPREQAIFNLPIVSSSLNKHIKLQKNMYKKFKNANKKALFISFTDGRAISGQMYWYKFNRVKEYFLNVILEKNIEDYKNLTSKEWSTHIGRGIYTNILAFVLGWNEGEIAIARGDRSIESSKSYVEERNLIIKTIESTNRLAKQVEALRDRNE